MHETWHGEGATSLGEGLSVARHFDRNRLTLVLRVQTGSDCILHWGLSRCPGRGWQRPPDACWPEGTTAADGHAVRTPLSANERGERQVAIQLELPCPWRHLPFVLYFPKEKRWVKSGGRDFSIPLPRGNGEVSSPEEALKAWVPQGVTARRVFTLNTGEQLAVATCATPEVVRTHLVCDADAPLVLHWGVVWRFPHEWQLPPESFRPARTSVFDQQ